MDHFAIYRTLDENFGPLNPISVEIKEALKLPEEVQEILEAIWDGRLNGWWMIPVCMLTKIMDSNPSLSRKDLQIKFHALTYLAVANLTRENPESNFDFLFEASAYVPLLTSPLNDNALFWDGQWD